MLFISSKSSRPKRIQGAYVSEKDIGKVTDFIKEESAELKETSSVLSQNLKDYFDESEEKVQTLFDGEDPFYEEAKRVVIEAQKASSSLLQRRLRIGYARAARLIDILEDKGIVGPADGAKPREIYGGKESDKPLDIDEPRDINDVNEESGWEKV